MSKKYTTIEEKEKGNVSINTDIASAVKPC
jgi:hypothetical protein